MISFPNAKINLGLNITKKREDGFHEIESVFYPVKWQDALEISPREDEKVHFRVEGMKKIQEWEIGDLATEEEIADYRHIDDLNPPRNLCEKAYSLMQEKFDIPGADIFLKKHIPIGAGLGGGSSDASFTLRMVNDLYNLNCSNEELKNLSAKLGSDCPFFIENRPMYVSGRGDEMEPIDLKLTGYHIVLIYPGIKISTKWAYKNISPQESEMDLKTIVKLDFTQWREHLKNDFQSVIVKERPHIKKQIHQLYDRGAVYAAMSGSGSTVFGIFRDFPEGIEYGPDDIHVTLPL
ncbi:4-(cytidine 5'-diphospho)-2-C-methyl-D-erythritol kinase [Halocola ammonii]